MNTMMALSRHTNAVSCTPWRGILNRIVVTRNHKTETYDVVPGSVANTNRREKFKKKFKKLLNLAQTRATVDFELPKKTLHMTENHEYTKHLVSGYGQDDVVHSSDFDKTFWTSRKAMIDLAEQHAYYIEMPGRLEYTKGDFNEFTDDKLLKLLQNDAEFRFQRKKSFFKQKRLKNKQSNAHTHVERFGFIPTTDADRQLRKQITWRMMYNFEMPVVMDMGFESRMRKQDMADLVSQLDHAIAYNIRQPYPFPISFINMDASSYVLKLFEKRGESSKFADNYITVSNEGISSMQDINREDFVYLSPHARNTMESFDWNKCYIIGGYVDKTTDGLSTTSHLARMLSVECYKFPVEKYLIWGNYTGRQEFTIDIVFKILHTLRHTNNWAKALQHIPKRFHRGLTEFGVQEASRDEELLRWYENIYIYPHDSRHSEHRGTEEYLRRN